MTHQRGQAMVLGYLTLLVLTILGNSLLSSSLLSSRQAQIKQLQEDVFYLAEGGMEDAAARFATAIATFQVDKATPCYPYMNPCSSLTESDMLATTFPSAGATARSVITETPPATELTVTDPDGTPVFIKHYRIRTTVTHPTNPTVIKVLNQVVTRRLVATFQHAVFYDNDLEWLPGATMSLSGRVHSNHDIYLGANGFSTLLTVTSEYLRSAGSLYNRRKDDPSDPAEGTVQIKKAGTSTYVAVDGLDSEDSTWATDSQTRWAGTVQTGVHGVKKLAVPVVGSTTPSGYYATNANIKIVNDVVMDNQTGNVIPAAGMAPGTIRTVTVYDDREAKNIRLVEINLKRLSGMYDCNGDHVEEPCYPNYLPANGLLYVTRNDASSTEKPGVRLVGGSSIRSTVTSANPNAGLTVVTNDPLYILGDFNTSSKKPVAVIADAINVLSNGWSDSKATQSLDNRVATATTVNAAMVTGIVPTPSTPGPYSGGLENYTRLHEKWTGVQLQITGSFVSLWNSQIATGQWHYGAPNYTAPLRVWAYDAALNSASGLPPFTPMAVEISNEAWWEE